jgi:hypothetical protein
MNTYTTEDINAYLNYLIKRYPNSNIEMYVKSLQFIMFAEDGLDNFEKIVEKIKKGG